MRPSKPRRWRAHVWVLAAVVLSSLIVFAPASAAPAEPCTSPPPVFPINRLERGQRATGWTVLQGTEPESFGIKILGVLDEAIAPGYDLILVKASGANIERIGGMGPGFSGSPVYRGDRLVGSVSYGLIGDAHYGALTPGQLLVDILGYPGKQQITSPQRVTLTRAARSAIAREAGVELREVASSLEQLPLPMAVAGATDERMAQMQARLADDGISVVPYRAASSSSSPRIEDADPIEAGDVFSAAFSYGTITYAGVGTATIACGDYVVAFGHSFNHSGGGRSGAVLDGEVVSTIPTGVYYPWPFKVANVGALRGVLDQDRLAGIRGVMGAAPKLAEVTSSITNLDTGRTLDGTTQVADPRFMQWIAWDHVYSSIHAALDAHSGTTWATWTVEGTSDGEPFSIQLSNTYTGRRVLWGPSYDIYSVLRSLERADGRAKFTSLSFTAEVTEDVDSANVFNARTASTTDPGLAVHKAIDVAPGDTLSVRVPLVPRGSDTAVMVNTSFTIPDTVTDDGELRVRSSFDDYYIRSRTPGTIDEVIKQLQRVTRNDELYLWVKMRGMPRALIQRLPQDWVLSRTAQEVRLRLV